MEGIEPQTNKMNEVKIFMIVDDDSDDRFFFREAVKSISPSHECLEAEDGRKALELLQKAEKLPDFVFLDLNMPLMDGRHCLEELKKDEKLKNIPVIIYSTSSSTQEVTNLRKLGAAYHLNKPTNTSKLPSEIINAVKIVEQGIHHE